jgi:hypothetical protein
MNVPAQELLVPRPTHCAQGCGDFCGAGVRLAHRVAQVCNSNARDHRRVAKDGWRAGQVSDMDMIATTFDIAIFLSRLTRTLSIR